MKTAVVLFNLGGPDTLSAVEPFLFNLFYDKAILGIPNPIRYLVAKIISKKRVHEAQEIYKKIGGKSPIFENTTAQAEALETVLNQTSEGEFKVFIAMRYWHPTTDECLKEIDKYKPDQLFLLPLYPQYSTTTTQSSFDLFKKQLSLLKAPQVGTTPCTPQFEIHDSSACSRLNLSTIPVFSLCCYPLNQGFIEAQVDLILDAKIDFKTHRLLFSAHSLPEKIVKNGDPYKIQVENTTERVIEQLKKRLNTEDIDYVTCFQSRVGPIKWLDPETSHEIHRAAQDQKSIVIVPISFVSEHSETLVELDIQYRELAENLGIKSYIRIPAVGTHPKFIQGLATIVQSNLNSSMQNSSFQRKCAITNEKCCFHKTDLNQNEKEKLWSGI